MELSYRIDPTISGGLSNLVLTTTTAALVAAAAIGPSYPTQSRVLTKSQSIFADAKPWESLLGGHTSTGATTIELVEWKQFQSLRRFAAALLGSLTEIPVEYDRIFQDEFRDLLA